MKLFFPSQLPVVHGVFSAIYGHVQLNDEVWKVCYSSWVVSPHLTSLELLTKNPSHPQHALVSCYTLTSIFSTRGTKLASSKVILAFKQCQNMPVACMHVLSPCSGLWYKTNEEGWIPSLCLLPQQSLSTTRFFHGNFSFMAIHSAVAKWPRGNVCIGSKNRLFWVFYFNWSMEAVGKRSPSVLLISLPGSFLQSCVRISGDGSEKHERWKQEKQGPTVRSHLC